MSSCDDLEIDDCNMSQRCSSDLHINVSPMVRTYFFTLDLSRKNLHNLPTLLPRVQRLVACDNLLSQLPPVSSLLNLHYLDLSGNYIEVIPRNLNELRELDTVKFNSNLITKIVALTKVRVYQVLGNPIQHLEVACAEAKMEQFGLDWLAYLDSEGKGIYQERVLTDWKKRLSDYNQLNNTQYIDLEGFLQHFLNPQQRTKMIKKNIYHAILKKHYQFFVYLPKMLNADEVPEEYQYQGKLLFELALQTQCDVALNFFKKQKFSKNSSIQFLNIASRHSSLEFFSLMIKKGHSIHQSYRNLNSPLHQLIANFDSLKSPPILHTLLKFLLNSNCKNHKKLNCLVYSAMKKPHCFAQFLRYLLYHQELLPNFNFDEVCGVKMQENTLHFAARLGQVLIASRLLELDAVDPFVRNSYNKRAKNITSHYMIRKLLTKYQKKYLKRSFKLAQQCEDFSQEVLVSLPSMRFSQSTSSSIKSLQLQMMKSLQLCEKIRLVLNLLYFERQKVYDAKAIHDILNLGFQDIVLQQLILDFLQRQHSHRQFIAAEIEHQYRNKLNSTSADASCHREISQLELFQQFQTIASSNVSFRTHDSPSSVQTVKPFSFPLCNEVQVAEESIITIEPKVMKTFRDIGGEKKQTHHMPRSKLEVTMETVHDMASSTIRKPHLDGMTKLRAQARRLSLTFIR